MYGHRWTSQFGEADDGTWLAGLRNLTPEQIGHGLSRTIEECIEWPPTLPHFRDLCLRSKSVPAAHRLYKSLPRPEVKREIIDRFVAEMREAVK